MAVSNLLCTFAMSNRREKAKAQAKQSNSLLTTQEIRIVNVGQKSRKDKISNYLIDISKYTMTGVVIASLFKDLTDNKVLIYFIGLFIAFTSLGVGIVLTKKIKE